MIARKKARKDQEKQPRKNLFPSDEESIELRRASAEVQAAKVKPPKDGEGVFGTYAVGSMQWESPCRVQIRDFQANRNSCSCGDYEMNRLGTCKHIERTLQYLARRAPKRDLAAASSNGSPFCGKALKRYSRSDTEMSILNDSRNCAHTVTFSSIDV